MPVQIFASQLQDFNGNPLTGQVTFAGPVDLGSKPVAASQANGPVEHETHTFLVQEGKIVGTPTAPTDASQCVVADTQAIHPPRSGYRVEFFDSEGRFARPWLLCVQPSGSAWSLDGH